MVNAEELLEEAKLRYPIVITINCVFGNTKNTKVNNYQICDGRGIYTNSNTWILLDGKWAVILSKPEIVIDKINNFEVW